MLSPAARSLQVFGLYLCGAGLALMLVPGLLLAPLGLAAPADVWGRVVGVLALILGVYYQVAARAEFRPLMQASVWLRGAVIIVFAAFVMAGWAPPALLVFGAVDLAAALWTGWALRQPPAVDMGLKAMRG